MVVVPTWDLHNVIILSHLSLLHIMLKHLNQVLNVLFVIRSYTNLHSLRVIIIVEVKIEEMLDVYLFCFSSFMDATHLHLFS